jgi:hypothetical protein
MSTSSSTPALCYDTFLIVNINTSRYVAADSSSAVGKPVKTFSTLDDEKPDNNRFSVSSIDGQYIFMNVANGLSLAPGVKDEADNQRVAWHQSPFRWDASSAGPGSWNMNVPGFYSYWSDQDASDHTIQLVLNADESNGTQWKLIAA